LEDNSSPFKGMGIAIAGMPVSGKDTTAELLSKLTGLPLIRGTLRQFAIKKGLDILEFEKKYSKESDRWDKLLDEWQREEVESHSNSGYILVSMLSAYNAPRANLKVWLYCGLEERAKRVSKRDNIPAKKAVAYVSERDKTFLERINKLYNINPWSLDFYDLVLNTEFWPPEKVASLIVSAMKERRGKI